MSDDDNAQRIPWVDWWDWDPSKESIAMIASGDAGTNVIWYAGFDIGKIGDEYTFDSREDLSTINLVPPSLGIWVWTGRFNGSEDAEGEWRKPTPVELASAAAGEAPWNIDDWLSLAGNAAKDAKVYAIESKSDDTLRFRNMDNMLTVLSSLLEHTGKDANELSFEIDEDAETVWITAFDVNNNSDDYTYAMSYEDIRNYFSVCGTGVLDTARFEDIVPEELRNHLRQMAAGG